MCVLFFAEGWLLPWRLIYQNNILSLLTDSLSFMHILLPQMTAYSLNNNACVELSESERQGVCFLYNQVHPGLAVQATVRPSSGCAQLPG